jgi:hypothetical protein
VPRNSPAAAENPAEKPELKSDGRRFARLVNERRCVVLIVSRGRHGSDDRLGFAFGSVTFDSIGATGGKKKRSRDTEQTTVDGGCQRRDVLQQRQTVDVS